MQYLLLIYRDEATDFDPKTPEFATQLAAYNELMDDIKAKGHFVGAEPLKSVATATTLRKQDGKLITTDGPFAETKEQLAGYFLVDCPDLDTAISYASRIPAIEVGSIEVRPLMDLSQLAPA